MTRLAHFAIGAVVATMLVGPAAWADVRQGVAHTGAALTEPVSSPAPDIRAAVSLVRSVFASVP